MLAFHAVQVGFAISSIQLWFLTLTLIPGLVGMLPNVQTLIGPPAPSPRSHPSSNILLLTCFPCSGGPGFAISLGFVLIHLLWNWFMLVDSLSCGGLEVNVV
jgi:hypothetical protein